MSDLAKENKLVVVPIEEYQDLNAMASKSLQDHATEQGVIVLSKNEHDDLTRAANKQPKTMQKKRYGIAQS